MQAQNNFLLGGWVGGGGARQVIRLSTWHSHDPEQNPVDDVWNRGVQNIHIR